MNKHTWYECNCNEIACQFCDGGLGLCTVCNGFEGTLTVECCGRKITEEEERLIYNERKINYVGGKWINFDKDCIIKSYEGYSKCHNTKSIGASVEHIKTGLIFKCSDALQYENC